MFTDLQPPSRFVFKFVLVIIYIFYEKIANNYRGISCRTRVVLFDTDKSTSFVAVLQYWEWRRRRLTLNATIQILNCGRRRICNTTHQSNSIITHHFTFLCHFWSFFPPFFDFVSMEAKVLKTAPSLHPVRFRSAISRSKYAFAIQNRTPARCSTYCSSMVRCGFRSVQASSVSTRYIFDNPFEESCCLFLWSWLLVILASYLLCFPNSCDVMFNLLTFHEMQKLNFYKISHFHWMVDLQLGDMVIREGFVIWGKRCSLYHASIPLVYEKLFEEAATLLVLHCWMYEVEFANVVWICIFYLVIIRKCRFLDWHPTASKRTLIEGRSFRFQMFF